MTAPPAAALRAGDLRRFVAKLLRTRRRLVTAGRHDAGVQSIPKRAASHPWAPVIVAMVALSLAAGLTIAALTAAAR
jgi:hypothetical protein